MTRTSVFRRGWQAAAAVVVFVAAPPAGRAGPGPAGAGSEKAAKGSETAGGESIPGDDDALYRCGKAQGSMTVSLRPGMKLDELAGWAMSFTCKNLVFSGAIGARQLAVTVMAPRPMKASEAWRLFLVALQSLNLTVVPRGDLLEIVEAPTAKRQSLPLFRAPGRAPGGEELVRVIFRPAQVTSGNLAQALTPLTSAAGEVIDLSWAGVVVVTDHGSHIAAMREMLEEIDRPGADQGLYFLPVRHAAATELVETLRALLETADIGARPSPPARPAQPSRPGSRPGSSAGEAPASSAAEAPARILADERTNSLILLASRPAYERTRALVERLDVDVEGAGGGRVHVHFLEHTSAEKMAETLGALLGQRSAAGRSGQGRPGTRPQDTRAPSAPARATPASAPAPAPDDSIGIEGDVRVTADPLSNSLLVLGSDRDYLALQKILRELDTPRPQVYIEALIIEVGSGWSRAIGTTWHAGHLTRDGMWLGALGHPQLSSFVNLGEAAEAGAGVNGFLGGIVGLPVPGMAELLGTSIPSFTVLFQALAQRDEVEILSAPHVTTTDHMEALLSSGQIIPFVSGATGLPGTTSGSAPLIERQPVGLTLKVTPHVGATGKVRLDIDLVLEDVLPGGGEFGPSTSNRHIKNSVVVGDQESAVLGGLMTQKVQRFETKIPLLGDIPILGLLFRRTERKHDKANLVVLITPFVMLDSLDGVRSVERVLERRTEFLGALDRLDQMGYLPGRKPTRMRGLISEIAHQSALIDEQRAQLRKLEHPGPGPAGPILPTPSSIESAMSGSPRDASAANAP